MNKQQQLKLETLCRSFDQMMVDVAHNATTAPPSDVIPSVTAPEIVAPEIKVYSFDVLVNGKTKHTIMDTDEQKAKSKAMWIAKQAAIKGWPSAVRVSK